MTDKEYEEQKARVKKYWDKWFKDLGLSWWKVTLEWDRRRSDDEPQELARTETRWQYRTANVTFRLPVLAQEDDDSVEECIVHEMSHILLGGCHDLRDDQAREITEYTVTTISWALMWAREAGQKDKG